MSTLCTLQNLSLTYPYKQIFKDVSFNVNEGDKIGLLGLNGHGKTSLFKILNEEVTPDKTSPAFMYDKCKDFSLFLVPQELPIFKGINISNYFYEFYPEFKKIKSELNMIEKKISEGDFKSDAEFEKLIEKQGKCYDTLHELNEDRIYNQYISYLKYFEIENLEQYLENMSGGEQRKVALSLGLSAPHKIVLWDEPTNHLDLHTIKLFEDELENAGKTYLIISHDRSLLNNVVNRIIHIQFGKIKSFKGTYFDYLNFLIEEEQSRAKELDKLANTQRRETAWIRRGAKARRTKSKKRIEDYSTLNNTIRELKEKAHKQVNLNIQGSGRKTKILFETEGLNLTFGQNTLFNNVNLTINKGDKIAIMGKNGVGKSSFLKIILNELQATSGKINRAENLSVGYFSQKREVLDLESTPWKFIGEGIDYVISNTGMKKHVAAYLESFLFNSEEIKRPIKTFSGGEKNRLQLAHFMKHAQDIWIFDEPTNDLDLETIGILEEELRNYEGALIIVSHDKTFIENVTNKCWLIYEKNFEQFDGGFNQAELFLEAIELEYDLQKAKEQEKSKKVNSPKDNKKLSQAEVARHKELQNEIAKQEKVMSDLKEKLATFDFTNLDKSKLGEMEKLQQKVKKTESLLETLFNEWSILEEKI